MRKRIVPAVLISLSIVAVACSDDKDTTTTNAPDDTTAPTTGDTTGDTTGGGECVLDTALKIGFAADLGELGAFSDQPGSEAAQVMVDKLNDAGGVGGLPVEYVVKDIQGDPAATQRAAQELLDDGVNALIGPPFASTGAPLLDTVDGQAPIIFMASTDPSLADPSRGAFLASFSDPVQSAAVAEWAINEGHTTAVTLSSTDDIYFSGNPEYFTEVFEAAGGSVLGDYAYSLADADFSTQVNEIAGLSEVPDVLFTAMVMPQTQVLLEQLAAAGLADVIVAGVDGFDATVVWSAGDIANGIVFAAHTFPQEGNGVEQFLADAAAAGANIETISFGALAADAVQILAAAAIEACSVDPAALIAAIDGLVNAPVTTGTVTYAGAGGVPEKDVVILTIENGEPVFVEAIRPTNIPG
ncbi:MAG: ABC transporter substrate-binding protein [Actinobacteria bacterium]|nr:ABC transporter substrate-binding protein [Actinomycetota bacterium]